MTCSFRLMTIVALATAGTLCAQTTAADKPDVAEEAAYRARVAIVEALLDEPSDDELLRLAKSHRGRGDHASAAVFGLSALRGKPGDALVEYELACNFSLWGQKKLGARYLAQSADHGYWGYRVAAEDTDLNAIKDAPEFKAALAKIKVAFDREAPLHPPGVTVELPKGAMPAAGWPVLITLHGWASSRHDFDDVAKLAAGLGYVGVSLDGTEVMGPDSYMWTRENAEPTHADVQRALSKAGVKIDPKRVILHGFSQGAMHAARLLADHPESYRGAIANSPGSIFLLPKSLAKPAATGKLIVSVGSDESPTIGEAVTKLEAMWKAAGRPVRVIRFDGGHRLPPGADKMFNAALPELAEAK